MLYCVKAQTREIPRLTLRSQKRRGGMVRSLPPNLSESGGGRYDRPDSTGPRRPAEARADIPSITLAVSTQSRSFPKGTTFHERSRCAETGRRDEHKHLGETGLSRLMSL